MNTEPSKRGRPRKQNPKTAAERMRTYRRRKRVAGYKVVSKWQLTDTESAAYSDHQILDARSLALHCKIARKIERNMDLLEIPQRNLRRWRKINSDSPADYLNEWQNIMNLPWPAIASFITSFSNDAVRLRQSSPFAGVLTPKERKQVYEAFRT